MATTNKLKEEQIFVGDENGHPIELFGDQKKAFLEQRAKDQAEAEARKTEENARKAARLSALQKLGLTEKEINAIL